MSTSKTHLTFALEKKGQKPSDYFPTRSSLMATNCCICGKKLEKADSVQHMIGPVCREKYILNPIGGLAVPSKTAALDAFWGFIATAALDSDLEDYLFSNEDNFAMLADILIAYGSIVTHQKGGHEKILILAQALREIGYGLVADRLEEDRCSIKLYPSERIGKEDTHFKLFIPLKSELSVSQLYKFVGKSKVEYFQPQKTRRGCYWEIPKASSVEMLFSLSLQYGRERFFQKGMKTIQTVPTFSSFGDMEPCQEWLDAHIPAVTIQQVGANVTVHSPAPWSSTQAGNFSAFVKSFKWKWARGYGLIVDHSHLKAIEAKAKALFASYDVKVDIVSKPVAKPVQTAAAPTVATVKAGTATLVTFTKEGKRIRMKSPAPWTCPSAGALVATVKATRGRKYDGKTYTWTFPASKWDAIKEKAEEVYTNQWVLV